MEKQVYKNKEEELEHKWQCMTYLMYHEFKHNTTLTIEDIDVIMRGVVDEFLTRTVSRDTKTFRER